MAICISRSETLLRLNMEGFETYEMSLLCLYAFGSDQFRPKLCSFQMNDVEHPDDTSIVPFLVGGLEHEFYFPIYWE